MHKFLPFVFFILICFACNDDPLETKVVPDSFEIDLNQDGVFDFQIIYEKLSVSTPISPDPGPFDMIRGKFISENGNKLFKKEEVFSILFLDDIDWVESEPNTPFFWEESTENNPSILMTISQDFDTWPENWRVNNEEIKDVYLIGFKLSDNTEPHIGAIELSIDDQTGEIAILNIEFLQ